MAACHFQLDVLTKKGNVRAAPVYPPTLPLGSMEDCRESLCNDNGTCVPVGFHRPSLESDSFPPTRVRIPDNDAGEYITTKTEDECIDDCRVKKECKGLFYDQSNRSCLLMTKQPDTFEPGHAEYYSRNDIYVENPSPMVYHAVDGVYRKK
tara:strand:- start:277 stop:729 length:453 start_codon:yes stop_codon:yes gene_type:complete